MSDSVDKVEPDVIPAEEKRYTPVAAISKDLRCVVLDDGRRCEFSEMYDAEGDATEDVTVAVSAVAPHPDGPWIVIHFRDFDGVTIH